MTHNSRTEWFTLAEKKTPGLLSWSTAELYSASRGHHCHRLTTLTAQTVPQILVTCQCLYFCCRCASSISATIPSLYTKNTFTTNPCFIQTGLLQLTISSIPMIGCLLSNASWMQQPIWFEMYQHTFSLFTLNWSSWSGNLLMFKFCGCLPMLFHISQLTQCSYDCFSQGTARWHRATLPWVEVE